MKYSGWINNAGTLFKQGGCRLCWQHEAAGRHSFFRIDNRPIR